ncbi:MAG: GTP 3',8-cyclase MoaA [Anaerolineae bacterium]|nr:GTP 3',8-cyclase MoaA [Anaerolineae bacterium]
MRLTDTFNRPLRDLRISVVDKCNFRCNYCMPAEIFGDAYAFLPNSALLTFEEIIRLTRLFVQLGVVKVRLTGGEPLLRPQLEQLVRELAAINGIEDMALTTNGYFLAEKAQVLKDAGLHRATVSLDTLDDEVFRQMNGRKSGVAEVLRGIEAAEQAGLTPIKINAVIQRGVNDHTILDLARFCKERGYVVRFIEYMDVGNINGWRIEHVVPAREVVQKINAVMPLEPADEQYRGEVAKRYLYKDGQGEIGLIASVTMPFCGDCTRLRLSADGKMYTCLFAALGKDLRDPMRQGATDDELAQIITGTWKRRDDQYSEDRFSLTPRKHKIEMYHIGG